MALASNSHNERAFTVHADIGLEPALLGTVLTATASQSVKRGRNAVNDPTVTDAAGTVNATFRGRTRQVGGSVIDALG
jgi:acyl-CoA thioesterase